MLTAITRLFFNVGIAYAKAHIYAFQCENNINSSCIKNDLCKV